jgi:hypothetical protein
MQTNWAAEHLQVIRTLMERSALYRRTLAPMLLLTGSVGVLGAAAGWRYIALPRRFVLYWLVIGASSVVAAYVMARLQALKDSEAFWSPPTRRVTQGLLPPLVVGLLVTVGTCFGPCSAPLDQGMTLYPPHMAAFVWLPAVWIALYGCALNAAGFFMRRGIKLFGWVFILGGCSLFGLRFDQPPRPEVGHALMGGFFGLLHLAYGVYLYFTEQKQPLP